MNSEDRFIPETEAKPSGDTGGTVGGNDLAYRRHLLQTHGSVEVRYSGLETHESPGGKSSPGIPGDWSGGGQGPYRFRRVIGRGGMGEVWEAVQVTLGRVVAVKRVIEREDGHDDRRHRDFRHEAMITARLEHPNIVPVHDLDMSNPSRPLLTMKRLRGEPWDRRLAREAGLYARDEFLARNIQVLISVAQAVAFAHSQGVVHRDIKPAQVMVGEFGEVMLTDWGLAIYVGGEEDSEELAPELRAALENAHTASNPAGTPAMMAPEQARSDPSEIGPWTDVYLLGGTLFYVLTGDYPHGSVHSVAAQQSASNSRALDPRERIPELNIPDNLAELCIRATQPRVTDRLATAREFLEALQDHQSGESKRRESRAIVEDVRRLLPNAGDNYRELGELLSRLGTARANWIGNPEIPALRDEILSRQAMHAMHNGDLVLARNTVERIESAELRGELVESLSRAETLATMARRQRWIATAATIVLLGVLAVGGTVFSLRLESERSIAVEREEEARLARRDADELVRFMISDLRDRLVAVDPDLKLLNETAAKASAYYELLLLRGGSLRESEVLRLLSGITDVLAVLLQQGNVREADSLLKAADLFHRKNSAALADNAEWMELAPAYHLARAQCHGVTGAADMQLEEATLGLQYAERLLAQEPEAIHRLVPVVNLLTETASAQHTLGLPDRALAALDDAERRVNELLELHPESVDLRAGRIGLLLWKSHTMEHVQLAVEMERLMNLALEELEQLRGHPNAVRQVEELLDSASVRIASLLEWKGDLVGAEDIFRNAAGRFRRNGAENPLDRTWKRLEAHALIKLAGILELQGKITEGVAAAEEAHGLSTHLQELDPAEQYWVFLGSQAASARGQLALRSGDATEGLRFLDEAVELNRELIARDADSASFQRGLAAILSSRGNHRRQARHEGAEADLRESLAITEALLQRNPGHRLWSLEHATALYRFGWVVQGKGADEEARASYRRGMAIMRQLIDSGNRTVQARQSLSAFHIRMGGMGQVSGDYEGALREYEQSQQLIEGLAREFNLQTIWKREIAIGASRLGDVLLDLRRHSEAAQYIRQAIAVMDELAALGTENFSWTMEAVFLRYRLAIVHYDSEDMAEAEVAIESAIAMMEKHVAEPRSERPSRKMLARLGILRGIIQCDAGRQEDGLRSLRETAAHSRVLRESPGGFDLDMERNEGVLCETLATFGGDYISEAERTELLQEAVAWLATRVTGGPIDPVYTFSLARAHWALGNAAEAVRLIEVLEGRNYQRRRFREFRDEVRAAMGE